jgi:hypothetical protein
MRGFGFVLFKDRLGYLRVFEYGEIHMIKGKQVSLADQVECRKVLLRDELQSQTPKVAAPSSQKDAPQFSLDPEQAAYMLQAYQMMLASYFPNMGELSQVDPVQFQNFFQNLQSQFAVPYNYSVASIDSSSSYFSQSSGSMPDYGASSELFYGPDGSAAYPPHPQKYLQSPDNYEDAEFDLPSNFGDAGQYSFHTGPGGSYTPETRSHRETSLQPSQPERQRNKTSGNTSENQLRKAVNVIVEDNDSDYCYKKSQIRQANAPPINHTLYGKPSIAKSNLREFAPTFGPQTNELRFEADSPSRDIDLNQVFSGENWIFVQDFHNPPESNFTKPQNKLQKKSDVDTAEEELFGFKLIEPLPSNKPQASALAGHKKSSAGK